MLRPLRSPLLIALAALLLATLAAPLLAAVDVAIGNGDKVIGTFNPADEVETFRIDVPEGAVFKLKVKSKPIANGQPKPSVTLRLFHPSGSELALGLAKLGKTSATLAGFRAPVTGTYRVQVSGDGVDPANYQLLVKWKSPRRLNFALDDIGPGAPSTVVVPADAGALVTVKLKAVKGSAATPVAARIEGTGAFTRDLLAPPVGATSHTVKKELVPVFGDARIIASGGGQYTCRVSVKPPKSGKRKIALTGAQVGGDPVNGGDQVLGQIVGPTGGGFSVGAEEDSPIAGAGISIPNGAITSPTPILMGTSSPMAPQVPGEQSAGPTVFFGPEGLQFNSNVEVTIPYDAAAFDGGDLRVFTRAGDGTITEITTFTFDAVAGTVTIPVSHFSSFRTFGPRLPPPVTGDLDGDGTGELVLRAPAAGKVYVFKGGPSIGEAVSTANADFEFADVSAGAKFGEAVIPCDLNQDGREDLVVAAPLAGLAGRVYVFFGSSEIGSRTAASADAIISARQGDFGFGIRVASGDVNGDGTDDLIVGAEGSSAVVQGAGAAYVFYGSAEFGSRTAAHADVVLAGVMSNDGFGAAVASADVTGDGIDDVIVGADQILNAGKGRVFVFAGGPALRSIGAAPRSIGAAKATFTFSGTQPFDGFGLELATGDLDGDGTADLVVSSAGDDDVGANAGAVFVYFGGRLALPPAVLTGEGAEDDFGFAVQAADLDGDLDADLVVTAELVSSLRGRAYVFAGTSPFASVAGASATALLTGQSANDGVGPLQLPWDVDGDQIADLVVYAPGRNANAGAAYVYTTGNTVPATGDVTQAPVIIAGQSGEALGGRPTD